MKYILANNNHDVKKTFMGDQPYFSIQIEFDETTNKDDVKFELYSGKQFSELKLVKLKKSKYNQDDECTITYNFAKKVKDKEFLLVIDGLDEKQFNWTMYKGHEGCCQGFVVYSNGTDEVDEWQSAMSNLMFGV